MTIEPLPSLDGVRLLRAGGEVDVASVPDLLPTVRDTVAGWRAVVLDLTAVTFFDSSGVRLVDRFARECARAGAVCRVIAPPGGRARRVLEIVGMAGSLVSDDLDDALVTIRRLG